MTSCEFNQLATYNSEVARGILHTVDWKERMARLQAEFNAEMEANPFGRHSWNDDDMPRRRPWGRRRLTG